MPKLSIRRPDEIEVVHANRVATDEMRATMTEGELASQRSPYFPHDDETLELFKVTLPAHAQVRPHAHSASEIMYVLDGELRFGAQRAERGAAVFIDRDVIYSFRAGPEGVTFLNFRGEIGSRYIPREEFRAARDAEQELTGADLDQSSIDT